MGLERSEAAAVRQVPEPNYRIVAGADEYGSKKKGWESLLSLRIRKPLPANRTAARP